MASGARSQDGLTEKERLFCEYYLGEADFVQWIAGYMALNNGKKPNENISDTEKTKYSIFSIRLKKRQSVNKYLTELRNKRFMKHEDKVDEIISTYRTAAFYDYSKLAEWDGKSCKFRSSNDIPEELRKCITEIENTAFGIRVKMISKEKALDSLSKFYGLYNDKLDNGNNSYESILEKLRDMENRNASKHNEAK